MNLKQESQLKRLKKKYSKCKNCDLYLKRIKTVFGKGLCRQGVMILGEAPGPEEDKVGDPFIGRAGKILDKLLRIAGLKRNDCFIFNSAMCYPGRNSSGGFNKPNELQIIRCVVRMKKTITILNPRLIVLLGGTALNALTARTGIARNRGLGYYKDSTEKKVRIFVTYHPSACNRNPDFKEAAKEDWRRIGKYIKKLNKEGGNDNDGRITKRSKRKDELC